MPGRTLVRFAHLLCLLILPFILAEAAHAAAPRYTLVDPANLNANPANPVAAINDARLIVGTDTNGGYRYDLLTGTKTYLAVNDPEHRLEVYGLSANNIVAGRAGTTNSQSPVLNFHAGFTQYLTNLGGIRGLAWAVNRAGHAIGISELPNGYSHGFFYNGTNLIDLGTFGGNYSSAFGINERDEVVGRSDATNGTGRAFYYSPSTGITNLGTFGGQSAGAAAINNRGQILIVSHDPVTQTFISDRTNTVSIGGLAGGNTAGQAINDAGWVVGTSYATMTNFVRTAILYDGVTVHELNTLVSTNGWDIDDAVSINNHGEIVVRARWDMDRQLRHVLLIPDTAPPIARIIFPMANSTISPTFGEPWAAQLTLQTKDFNGHTITNLEVFDGTNRLNVLFDANLENTNEFFIRIPALSPGFHTIRASAVDQSGARSDFAELPLYFTEVAPKVFISPTNGTFFPYLSTITISLDATNATPRQYSGNVRTYVDDGSPVQNIFFFSNLPTTLVLSNMPAGTHRYQLNLSQDGTFATSERIHFVVGDPPTVPRGPYDIFWLPGLGGTNTEPQAINAAGEIVGASQLSNGNSHAFLFRTNQIIDLGTLGGSNSAALSINRSGTIAGWSLDASGQTHGVIWTNGLIQRLNFLTATSSEARDINDLGEIVGVADGQGFLWHGGRLRHLSFIPHAINNAGLVVGQGWTVETALYRNSVDSWPAQHIINIQADTGTLFAVNEAGTGVGFGFPGRAQDIGHLGLVYETRSAFRNQRVGGYNGETRLLGINQWRQFVGSRILAIFNNNPYVGPIGYINLPPYATVDGVDLNTLVTLTNGWSLSRAVGINDTGKIVAVAAKTNETRAVLLVPRAELRLSHAGNGLGLELGGYPGTTLHLETSLDLRTWNEISSHLVTTNGNVLPINKGETSRYYRASERRN